MNYDQIKTNLNELEKNEKNLGKDQDDIKKIIIHTFKHQNTLLKKEAKNANHKDLMESIIQENLTFINSFETKTVYDILSVDSTKNLENFLNENENLEDLKASLMTVEELKKRYLNVSEKISICKSEKENIEKEIKTLKETENNYEESRKIIKKLYVFQMVINRFILV